MQKNTKSTPPLPTEAVKPHNVLQSVAGTDADTDAANRASADILISRFHAHRAAAAIFGAQFPRKIEVFCRQDTRKSDLTAEIPTDKKGVLADKPRTAQSGAGLVRKGPAERIRIRRLTCGDRQRIKARPVEIRRARQRHLIERVIYGPVMMKILERRTFFDIAHYAVEQPESDRNARLVTVTSSEPLSP